MNKIRIKYGENEIEIEGTDDFIKEQLELFYERIKFTNSSFSPASLKEELLKEETKPKSKKIPSPAEYYRSKGRTDGISQLLIFAKYLELYRNKTEFSRADINNLAKEAKLAKDIHGQYFSNAVKQGLLRQISKGKYSLTLSAEELIASM